MFRQVRLATVATLAMANGFASGQGQPASVPAGSTVGGTTFLMKTAGQPDRRVQVIKTERLPDGTNLLDVRDLATGAIYSLTNPAVLSTADTKSTTATTAPIPAIPSTGVHRPLTGRTAKLPPEPDRERLVPADQVQQTALPQARERARDPLLAGAAKPAMGLPSRQPAPTSWKPGMTTPASITSRTPFPSRLASSENKSILGKKLGDSPRAVNPQVPAPIPASASIPARDAKRNPEPTIVMPAIARTTIPLAPALPKSAIVPPPETAIRSIPAIEPAAMPPTSMMELAEHVPLNPIHQTPIAIPSIQPAPVPEPVPSTVVLPSIPVVNVEIPMPAAVVQSAVVEAIPVEPAKLTNEILVSIDDLKNHKRPTFRMECATALAESKFAKDPTVIDAIRDAAANDRVGVVRGHCIALLADLGCTDAGFLKSLETWSTDREPAVQRAALAAKAQLGR